ncbi:MAG: aminotransferase class V-fold PLP-dependent enzyme [Proteobacteria bacterium]|nr:aminotransferase class V-fold PLP-dependent enzyme [Pseudomonadota bacterium]
MSPATELDDPRLAAWRDDTPGVANRVHLNNAGAALPPRPVVRAVVAHLEREAAIGGYEAADEAAGQVHDAYAAVAALLGAEPRNIAMVENATVGFNQALAAFDFQPGDEIVTSRNDYISNQLAYLSLSRRLGVVVRRAADLPEGGVDPESVRELLQSRRARLLAITWIPTNSGLVQPVEALGALAAAAGVPYLIDACQAVGQMPIDVRRLRCDFLSATARKFLRGPRGIGFLYVSDEALARDMYPLHLDMRGGHWRLADEFELAPDARRFENWEFAYALVLGLGAAARYASTIGLGEIERRARALAARLRHGLGDLPGVRLLDHGRELAAIVTAEVPGWHAPELVQALRARGVNTSAAMREYAVIDMDGKRAATALRLSPTYYNTTDELDAALQALRSLRR